MRPEALGDFLFVPDEIGRPFLYPAAFAAEQFGIIDWSDCLGRMSNFMFRELYHKTKEPMGTLANGDLRHKGIEAHRVFDQIWRRRIMTRANAYRWLREKYGLREDQAHIACFSEYICDDLIRECQKALRANRIAS